MQKLDFGLPVKNPCFIGPVFCFLNFSYSLRPTQSMKSKFLSVKDLLMTNSEFDPNGFDWNILKVRLITNRNRVTNPKCK